MTQKNLRPVALKVASLWAAALLLSGCGKSSAPAANDNEAAATPTGNTASSEATNAPTANASEAGLAVGAGPSSGTNDVADAAAEKPIVEAQIYKVAHSGLTRREKALEFFRMFDRLDRQGQRKVAHAAVEEVDDADHDLIRKYLFNRDLHPQVLSVFMTDTLKRKDTIRLPVLLQLARTDGHPLQTEARDLLHSLLQTNHGTDWAKWEQAVKTQIASSTN